MIFDDLIILKSACAACFPSVLEDTSKILKSGAGFKDDTSGYTWGAARSFRLIDP